MDTRGIIWLSIVVFLFAFELGAMAGTIAGKAGFSKWYGLLVLIPFVNIIALYLLAFLPWPSQKIYLMSSFEFDGSTER